MSLLIIMPALTIMAAITESIHIQKPRKRDRRIIEGGIDKYPDKPTTARPVAFPGRKVIA